MRISPTFLLAGLLSMLPVAASAGNYDWVPKGPAEQQLNRLPEAERGDVHATSVDYGRHSCV